MPCDAARMESTATRLLKRSGREETTTDEPVGRLAPRPLGAPWPRGVLSVQSLQWRLPLVILLKAADEALPLADGCFANDHNVVQLGGVVGVTALAAKENDFPSGAPGNPASAAGGGRTLFLTMTDSMALSMSTW